MEPDIVAQLRAARQERGQTQRRVAAALGTTQPVIARLESGRTTPRLDTVLGYAAAVGVTLRIGDVDLIGAARDEIVRAVDSDGADTALRSLIELHDALLALPGDRIASALRAEPELTGSPRWDAAIAATCERVANRRSVAVPGWTAAPSRFLDRWWFPTEDILGRVTDGLVCLLLATSPPEFSTRGVFIDGSALVSV